ncbi:membrane protein [Caldalkalibacillus thermarum]|uniref:metal-dependent hydrolase n=1 Tax=Caldalkalibacillus thermarum TaxID=296745 RepID=UPI00166BD211|nr:metal-dependent hydrolase [Caldalkalibacillus thermarum]GGK33187.1 membrane protein [Caldalkalibacillus thermarum]
MILIDWKTHFLSGAVAGYALTGQVKGAVIGGIAGILPDIDEPRSKIGRPFFFVSIPLNQVFGHRTLTHSLLLVGGLWFILQPFTEWANVIVIGLLVHIAGDMLTGKGQFLWPLPFSLGIPVGDFGYVLVDRTVRLALVALIIWYGWGYVDVWINQFV